MTSKEIENALANAEDAFQRSPENPETGLEFVTDLTILQLRKACRLLDAAQFLIDRNGHYTVIIEASFVAIERSIQFYMEASGYDIPGQSHTEVYEYGVQAGLFSEDIADRLEALWQENRSESYHIPPVEKDGEGPRYTLGRVRQEGRITLSVRSHYRG